MSIVEINSTTKSFLEHIDSYVAETLKSKEESDIIQWLSWNLEKAWSLNYVIDELWPFVNGNWNFEKNMSQKLTKKFGFEVARKVW